MKFHGIGQSVGGCDVYVIDENGKRELPLRLNEVRHSPSGFQWGYSGSGPAQLSYAMLRELYSISESKANYQTVKNRVISNLPEAEDFWLHEDRIRRHVHE